MARRKLTCSTFIAIDRRVDPHEAKQRMAERDARQASDTRTEAQKFFGDPPLHRSALARSEMKSTSQRSPASHARIDLWRK